MSICINTEEIKKLIGSMPSMKELNTYITTIEEYSIKQPDIALDASKSLLESLARTILAERYRQIKDDDFHKLIRNAIESIDKVQDIKDKKIITQLLQGFSTISLAIGTIRNKYGILGHGKDILSDKVEPIFAHFIIDCALSIAGFMLTLQNGERYNRPRLNYDDCNLFNSYFDALSEKITIGKTIISPSKALFNEDIIAYREYLYEFITNKREAIGSLNRFFSEDNLEALSQYKSYFSGEELYEVLQIVNNHKELYNSFNCDIKNSLAEIFNEDNLPLGYQQTRLNLEE